MVSRPPGWRQVADPGHNLARLIFMFRSSFLTMVLSLLASGLLLGGPWAVGSVQAQAAPEPSLRCPILYYHDVPSQVGLASQVAAFLRNGYLPISLSQLVDALDGRAVLPASCLVLTFDDALASQLTNALPVLQRFGVPATFFVMPGFRDGVHRYMTLDQIRQVRDAGFEIGSHTFNHANLPRLLRLNVGAFQAELIESRTVLEQELALHVDLFAYPDGAWDAATMQEVAAAGYRAAVTTRPGGWHRASERFNLRRMGTNPWEPPGDVLARLLR